MKITYESIAAALSAHDVVYATRRNWTTPEIAGLWRAGQRAFIGAGDRQAFTDVYSLLRRTWLVFRPLPAKDMPSADFVYSTLANLDGRLRTLSLTELTPSDTADLWALLSTVGSIKTSKTGVPSLVAVSKFLHFWNPRLFVIVDDAAMSVFALAHEWLRASIEAYGASVAPLYPKQARSSEHFRSYGLRYLDLLFWAGDVLRDNPAIMDLFAAHVRRHAGGQDLPQGYEDFQAAAIEWLLLGLVQLPPGGVVIGEAP